MLLLLALLAAPIIRPSGQTPSQAQTFMPSGAGATARTTQEKLRDTVSVRDYGATGDGTTDDTTAVQAAITAAQSAGAMLFVNRGTYIVKNLSVTSALRIEGEGRAISVFKLKVLAALDGSPIFNVTAAGVAFRHIGLDGQKASQPADGYSDSWAGGANGTGRSYRSLIKVFSGINGTILSGLVVEDCQIQNAYGAGLAAQDVSRVKARRNYGTGNRFETIYLTSTLGEGSSLTGQEVIGNEILNTASGDASVNGNAIIVTRGSGSVIAGNVVDTVERDGLKCEFCSQTVIANNNISNCTVNNFPGIQVQDEATSVVVTGNRITNCGGGITMGYASPGAGYFNVTISDNVIETTTGTTQGDGISMSALTSGGSGVTISGNTLKGIRRYCIYFGGGAVSNVVVRGNNCTTAGATTASGFQYLVDTTGGAGVVVSGNLFDLGGAATSAGGIYFLQSASMSIDAVSITGNTVLTGAGHFAIGDSATATITHGAFSGNVTDGYVSFLSTGVLVSDSNTIGSHNGWFAPSNGRVATTTPVTATQYDTRIITNLGVAGPVAITLPALGTDPNFIPAGHVLLIKDGKGDAAVNNITITRGTSTTIDGGTGTKVISTNGGSIRLVFDGTNNWYSF